MGRLKVIPSVGIMALLTLLLAVDMETKLKMIIFLLFDR